MSSYKNQQEKKHNFVLVKIDGGILGTFGNLRKIIKYMGGENFQSYSTLSKKREFPIYVKKGYLIYKVKHY